MFNAAADNSSLKKTGKLWIDTFQTPLTGPFTTAGEEKLLDTAIIKFIRDTYQILSALATDPPAEDELSHKSKLCFDATLSQLQRRMIELEESTSTILSPQHNEMLNAETDKLELLQRLWRLAEVFHMSNAQLSLSFGAWLGENSPSIEPLTADYVATLCSSLQGCPEIHLRLYSTVGLEYGYWEAIGSLAARGRLSEVSILLAYHSEFKQAMRGGYKQVCLDLHEALRSHPFAGYVTGSLPLTGLPPAVNLHTELTKWSQRIQTLHDSLAGSAFFSSIPELEGLLDIICPVDGDMEAVLSSCEGSWEVLVMAELLYHYPPPLSRESLCSLVDDAILRLPLPVQASQTLVQELQRILRGQNVGMILRRMYTTTTSHPAIGGRAVVGLMVTATVARLLECSRSESHLLQPLPDTSCTFYEQVLIEGIKQLCSDYLPLDLLIGVMQCLPRPDIQRSIAHALFSARVFSDDDDCLDVAEVLDGYGLREDAKRCLVDRGEWWAGQCFGIQKQTESVFSQSGKAKSYEKSGREPCVQAVKYFLLAGDVSRLAMCVDAVLYNLAEAMRIFTKTGTGPVLTPLLQHAPQIQTLRPGTGVDMNAGAAAGLSHPPALAVALRHAAEVLYTMQNESTSLPAALTQACKVLGQYTDVAQIAANGAGVGVCNDGVIKAVAGLCAMLRAGTPVR